MKQKRNALDIVGLVLGVLTIILAILSVVTFISSTLAEWSDPDVDVFGFAYLFLFVFACLPLLFVVFGILEIVKFMTAKKSRKLGKILFFIQCGLAGFGTVICLLIPVLEVKSLLVILASVVVCIVLGIVRLNKTKAVQNVNSVQMQKNVLPQEDEIKQKISGEKQDVAETRYCTYCGAKVDINNNFCGYCGKEISK